MFMRCLVSGIVGLSLFLSADVQGAKKKKKRGGGRQTVKFTEYHPETSLSNLRKRFNGLKGNGRSYKIEEESFQLTVPSDYDPKKRYGLLVWISAIDTGSVPRSWGSVLTKYKMIGIGANKSGNDHSVIGRRIPLAVDAVYNVMKQYSIDERRVYLSGMSGGGRTASEMAIAFADIFKGALYVCGCNSWNSGSYPNKLISAALKNNRYVLLTGTKDFNRPGTQSVYSHCYKSGFRYPSLYIEVPGLAHSVPGGEWFEKALLHLDAPIIEEDKRILEATQRKLAGIKFRGSKPEELIPFIKKLPKDSPVRKEAMALYVEVGKKRIATALAREKKSIKELHGIMEYWGYQPFAKDAKNEFNKLGEKVLSDMDTKKTPDSKYLRFIQYWAGCACIESVIAKYNPKAKDVAKKLLAESDPRQIRGNIANTAYRLSAFLKKYKGLPATDKVRERLSMIAAKQLDKIKGIKSSFSRKTSLRAFIRDYAGCPEADEAKDLLSRL